MAFASTPFFTSQMANLTLSRVLYALFQGRWGRATSPRVLTSPVVQRLHRNSQQQRLHYFQLHNHLILPLGASILPDNFICLAQTDNSFSEQYTLSESVTGRRAVRFSSTKVAAAEKIISKGVTEGSGKKKKQEDGAACRGDYPSDLKGNHSSYTAKSPCQPSTGMSFADPPARMKQGPSSAYGAPPGDAVEGGVFKEKSISQQRVVHGTFSGTGNGSCKREGGTETHMTAGSKQAAEDRDDDEVERISREDYWKLQERTSADFSTHPPYMYPMDPEMQPKGPPLSPHTRQKRPLK